MNSYKRSYSTFHMPKQQRHSRIRNHLIDRFLICFKTLFRFFIFSRSFRIERAMCDFIICSFLLQNSHPLLSSYLYYRYEFLFIFFHSVHTTCGLFCYCLFISFHTDAVNGLTLTVLYD